VEEQRLMDWVVCGLKANSAELVAQRYPAHSRTASHFTMLWLNGQLTALWQVNTLKALNRWLGQREVEIRKELEVGTIEYS